MLGAIIAAAGPIGTLADKVLGGLDELITTKEEEGAQDLERRAIALKAQMERMRPMIMALENERRRAAHPSWIVAGARVAGLWLAPVVVAWDVIAVQLINFVIAIVWAGAAAMGAQGEPILLHSFNLSWDQIAAMGGLSGAMGYYRSKEKRAGVARENFRAQPAEADRPTDALSIDDDHDFDLDAPNSVEREHGRAFWPGS